LHAEREQRSGDQPLETPELLSRFPQQTVLVVGDVVLDEYLAGTCSRVSPEAPVPVVHVDTARQRATLGGAANTAANVASLGGDAVLIGLIGDDGAGARVRALCEEARIGFHPIVDGRPTSRKARVIGQRQQLLRLDYEETHAVSERTEAALLAQFQRFLPSASIVVISDYAKGLLTFKVTQAVIGEAHAAGIHVIVDPRSEHFDHYRHCDYITPNWKESQELIGVPYAEPTSDRIRATGIALRDRLGSNVVLTLGPGGMAVFNRNSDAHFCLPTVAREVFDVSGAGDTVVAALALARAAGADLESAARLANRAAGVVVGKLGTAIVSPEELLDDRSAENRLVTRDRLAALSTKHKAKGQVVVTLNGGFDLLHAGHLHIIAEARQQGDILIVGLNSDASIRGYKGVHRPIIPERERAAMLLALAAVDYVHIFDETVPMPFLEAVKPHVHVNGSEYGSDCIEAGVVRAHGGRIHVVDKVTGLSTSEILARIRASP
jgi:D-beta-D-heptose 7-phosphate kinase/D-beta-D-heptose 1-phosphate adenosyltransferase